MQEAGAVTCVLMSSMVDTSRKHSQQTRLKLTHSHCYQQSLIVIHTSQSQYVIDMVCVSVNLPCDFVSFSVITSVIYSQAASCHMYQDDRQRLRLAGGE